MVLPLYDSNPLRHIGFAFVTTAMIAICVAVFVYQVTLPSGEAGRFVFAFGAIPFRWRNVPLFDRGRGHPVITRTIIPRSGKRP